MHWKKIKTRTVLKNYFLDITSNDYIRPDGKLIENFFRIKKPDGALVFGITQDKKIILIRQYRHAVNSVNFEVPAGYKDEKDKNLKETAKRELLEETGYIGKKFIKLGEVHPSAGLLTNKIHFYLALECKKTSNQKLDFSEDIEVHTKTFKEAMKIFNEGEIKDMSSFTCFLLGINYLKNETDLS